MAESWEPLASELVPVQEEEPVHWLVAVGLWAEVEPRHPPELENFPLLELTHHSAWGSPSHRKA